MTARARRRLDLELPEDAYLQTILDAADLCRWLAYHTRDSRGSRPGFPDLVLVRGGRLLALEAKAERGQATPEQVAWLAELRRVPGVTAEVVRPSDWPWVLHLLQTGQPGPRP